MGEFQINALRTILRGEEICIAYLGCRRLYGSPHQSRQAILRSRHHFTGACSFCSLPEAESKMNDARRMRVNELWEIDGRLTPTREDQYLNVVDEGIRLLKEEGCLMDVYEFMDEVGPM